MDATHEETFTPQIIHGDCSLMGSMPAGKFDLAFCDPPFNINFSYDIYKDKKSTSDYLAWCGAWGENIYRLLKPDGSFWLAIGDEYAAELKVLFHREIGFHMRSWVVWYYTFGVNCVNKFTRSHVHMFHFTKDKDIFKFNTDAVKVPSAREVVYKDKRAKPGGRLPDDTWILRPTDVPGGPDPASDTWPVPRVCGTFKERVSWHGCQMPELILARIILACTDPGDAVLDAFAGSGTTLAVAKKLGRRGIGFDISETYVNNSRKRLASVGRGDPIGSNVKTKQ